MMPRAANCCLRAFIGCAVLLLVAALAADTWAQQRAKLLFIGAGKDSVSAETGKEATSALGTLQNFIKSETGLNNKIVHVKSWRDLAQQLAGRQLQLGMFHGYEFAWAQQRYPQLKPLALAVNGYRYPVVYVVINKDRPADDFADLRGASVILTGGGVGCLRLYIDHECQARGTTPEDFFSRLAVTENVEDALDDAVDGKVRAVVVDRGGLEAYKHRKPGRFRQLKLLAQSQPFPAVVVAYCASALSPATLQRFRDGLLNAHKKEKGRTLLTLFRLTRFDKVPAGFDHVLTETRTVYPAPLHP